MNFIVAVRAAGTISAWRGLANSARGTYVPRPGMPAAAAGTTRIEARNETAALRVPQLFIPGTRREGAAAALFHYEGQWQSEGAKDWIFGSGSRAGGRPDATPAGRMRASRRRGPAAALPYRRNPM